MFYILPSQGCYSVNRSNFAFSIGEKSLSPISIFNFIFHIKNHINFPECKFFLLRFFSFISCLLFFFICQLSIFIEFSVNNPQFPINFHHTVIRRRENFNKFHFFYVDFLSNFFKLDFLYFFCSLKSDFIISFQYLIPLSINCRGTFPIICYKFNTSNSI